MSSLFYGDALEACAELPAQLRFDLVYLDPPFGLRTTMTARTATGEGRGRARRGSEGREAFDDPSPEALVAMLSPRLAAVRERMQPNATLWLHLDHRAVHEVKVEADRVFGTGAFLGEVIWSPGNGSRGRGGFSVTHQTLLMYARSAKDRGKVVWNGKDPILREPFATTSLSMHFGNVDEEGRQYREREVNGKKYRYYADEGRRLGSVWTDVPGMIANTPLHPEGTGYPTQKPERLLERIIKASSLEGQTVADLMCGSGTTLAVAARLGREFVGGDIGAVAIGIADKRLRAAGVVFERLGKKLSREA
jgi:site-specific DNA-methyltransferase (adenine-specific)